MMNAISKMKDKVAIEYGYLNWESFYNWIAREGEKPEVVAQQIESAMEDVIKLMYSVKINYGSLINPDKYYPVKYTITQKGDRVFKNQKIKGQDMTEPQIIDLLLMRESLLYKVLSGHSTPEEDILYLETEGEETDKLLIDGIKILSNGTRKNDKEI
jgi:hypothetical protein